LAKIMPRSSFLFIPSIQRVESIGGQETCQLP
jgi:hypothetical protein